MTDIRTGEDLSTEHKIIEAAIKLFALKGFAAVSVKEPADTAGVNVALISYYFGGKEKLYAHIFIQEMTAMVDTMEAFCQHSSDPLEKIRMFVKTLASVHAKHPYMDRLFYREMINPTPCFAAFFKQKAQKMHGLLSACLREAIAAGKIRADLHVDFATISLFNIVHFDFVNEYLTQDILPADENQLDVYVEQALKIFLEGVLAVKRE